MDDPLEFVDFANVVEHGDPSHWRFIGPKPGSPAPATSPSTNPGR